jgi:hypothetical protein
MSSTVYNHLPTIIASGSPTNDLHPNSRMLFTTRTSVTTLSTGAGATGGTYAVGAPGGANIGTWGITSIITLTIWTINTESVYGTRVATGTTTTGGGIYFG